MHPQHLQQDGYSIAPAEATLMCRGRIEAVRDWLLTPTSVKGEITDASGFWDEACFCGPFKLWQWREMQSWNPHAPAYDIGSEVLPCLRMFEMYTRDSNGNAPPYGKKLAFMFHGPADNGNHDPYPDGSSGLELTDGNDDAHLAAKCYMQLQGMQDWPSEGHLCVDAALTSRLEDGPYLIAWWSTILDGAWMSPGQLQSLELSFKGYWYDGSLLGPTAFPGALDWTQWGTSWQGSTLQLSADL
jgi:hypothetical protein